MLKKLIIILPILLLSNISKAPIYCINSSDLLSSKIDNSNIIVKIRLLRPDLDYQTSKTIGLYLKEASSKHNIPINTLLTIAYMESSFNQDAIGSKNEKGLMQIMPLHENYSCKSLNTSNLKDNIECGCRVLSENLFNFNGDILPAVTAYNRGTSGTKKLLRSNIDISKVKYTSKFISINGYLNLIGE